MNTPDTENGEVWAWVDTNKFDELLEQTRQEAILEGQRRAVEYIENQVEAFMDLETRRFGADTTFEEWGKLLQTARTLPVTEK